MRVLLIVPPWHLYTPSVATGVLTAVLRATTAHPVAVRYVNFEWAEYLLAQVPGVTEDDIYTFGEDSFSSGVGDWVFTSALYEVAEWRVQEYLPHLANPPWPQKEIPADLALAAHRLSPAFVESVAESVAATCPEVVGFNTDHFQDAAALALAQAIKRRCPEAVIVFSGISCDGLPGVTIHASFPFIDYVVRGDVELALPALLKAIEQQRPPTDISGLCWRRGDQQVVNDLPETRVSLADVLPPDFDDYFAAIEGLSFQHQEHLSLVLEGSRGCWWGEKMQCTFCAANGSCMTYRPKPPKKFLAELSSLVARHQVLDIFMAENILNPLYIRSVMPTLAQSGWDLCLHYEIKSNLNAGQLKTLAAAGVISILPGIESLDDHVLHLIRKGASGARQVEFLRDCQAAGVTTYWNYLYGFPGEKAADYLPVIAQMPALVHLQPPRFPARFVLLRFSPYFEQHRDLFPRSHPADFYPLIYDLPPERLEDLAYVFDYEPTGIDESIVERLRGAVALWRQGYRGSSLEMQRERGVLTIRDRRAGWPARDLVLRDPREVALYSALIHHAAPTGLAASLKIPESYIRERLKAWGESGLVFTNHGRYVALAIEVAGFAGGQVEWAVGGDWPTDEWLAAQSALGVWTIQLGGQPKLASQRDILNLLRFLREADSYNIAVSGYDPLPLDPAAIAHLSNWPGKHRDDYSSGRLYWRAGPGFALIIDSRGDELARYTIDGVVYEAFLAMQSVGRLSDLPARLRQAAADLVEAGLALSLGDWATVLPTRLRRWPIPVRPL